MASEGDAVSASRAMEMTHQDMEKPSPSQSLLQRLKSLREWQERQREELMQVLAHSNPSKGSTLTPLKEETPRGFSESVVTEDSVVSPHLVPHRAKGPVVTEDSVASPHLVPHRAEGPVVTEDSVASSHLVPHRAEGPVVTEDSVASPHLVPHRAEGSVVTEDSMPSHHLVPHRTEGPHVTVGFPGVETTSSVVTSHQLPVKPPEKFSEDAEVWPRQSNFMDQLTDSHELRELDPVVVTTRQVNHPNQAYETEWQTSSLTSTGPSSGQDTSDPKQNDLEGNERNVKEVEHDTPLAAGTQEGTLESYPASLTPQEDPDDFMDESMEDLFRLEKQKPYRSEKYKSPALSSKECLIKGATQASQTMKNFAPSKSFFCTMTQGPEGGSEDVQETPRPRHRFLRKGQGTSRFGMRPMRLKKKSATETGDESCHLPHTAKWSNAEVPLAISPPAPNPTTRQFRLPMQNLQLQEVPQRMTASMGERVNAMDQEVCGSVRHTASPGFASTQPGTTPLPGPLDLEKQQRKEEEELSAFEKLEELAEDSSFSSNSSTVWHLLKQGQQSVSSTPLRTPPPLALQETPVVGSLGMESKTLGIESQSVVGDLINRVLPPRNGTSPHQQQVAVDVKEVLAQLKAIVRLEGHSISDVTESDIQSFLEGCSNQYSFDVLHPTSTPALPQPSSALETRPHHVHFASEGVQVMEYELSDTEGEDTLTEAASLDSDLITTSDLEALTQLSVKGGSGSLRQQLIEPSRMSAGESSSSEAILTEQEGAQGQGPFVLTFSPPPPRPAQSASNYIWSIFGKERDAKKRPTSRTASKQAKETHQQPPLRPHEIEKRNVASTPQPGPDGEASQELEVHKTLLLAKVAELEKETNLFKKENSKLKRLQQEVQEERQKLEKEKHKLQEEAATERRKFQEYVDRERNALWREKQQVIQRSTSVMQPQPQEHVLEIVRLREQIRMLREEAERKDSLNQFTVKKLNDQIQALENENKKLKKHNNSLQALEKENQDLLLKVDRARAGGRARPASQPLNPTRGRSKSGSRATTVDGVAKALGKMTKPQPVIVKEAQSNPSKTKQDLANNNLVLGATESVDDVLTKKGSNTETETSAAPALKDTPGTEDGPTNSPTDPLRHGQTQLPVWVSLGCTEEVGLEHTERVREDGIHEVIYANGNRKEIHPSGEVTISFYNGDRKEIHADRTVYVYGSDHTSHTTYSSGKEEFIFPSGQQETRHPDGSYEISFPNGSRKSVLNDGTEICTTKDGSVVRTNPDGSQVFEFPSGQREVHRGGEKRREYPDGTVKILHPDGRAETRYSSGRIRIKDREGNVILDSRTALSSSLPS